MEHNARACVDGSIKSGREKRYIACQGPLASTCNDFWHMIWEERISVIVMLTKLKENERVRSRYLPHEINAYTRGRRSYAAAMLFQCKCFQYWPDDEPEAYGSVTVIPSDTKSLSDSIVLRTFLLFHGEVGGSREAPLELPGAARLVYSPIETDHRTQDSLEVSHFQYEEWPDHGTPHNTARFRELLFHVDEALPSPKDLILVHCR